MAKLCPFRKASWVPTPPDPDPEDPTFDPEDGSWLWVTRSPYNATGNGSTDDRTAIQACINAAASQSKGVYIPAGTYLVSNYISVPSNLAVRGVGDTSLLRTTATELVRLDGVSDITLQNIALDQNANFNVAQAAVFLRGNVSDLTFRNVTVSDCGIAGFYGHYATSIYDLTWDGCVITNCGCAGIMGGNSNAVGCTVVDCTFTTMGGFVEDYPPHGLYVRGWDNLTVERCTASYITRSGEGNYGWGGYDIEDSTGLTMNRCTAHHCDPAPGGGNGFAFIGTTGTLTDCVADVEVDPGCYYPNSDITFIRFSGTRQT